MSRRWLVERTKDDFEDVGAFDFHLRSGALCFTDEDGEFAIIYAAGQWLTVVPNEAV